VRSEQNSWALKCVGIQSRVGRPGIASWAPKTDFLLELNSNFTARLHHPSTPQYTLGQRGRGAAKQEHGNAFNSIIPLPPGFCATVFSPDLIEKSCLLLCHSPLVQGT
jgi:hypothetical protein